MPYMSTLNKTMTFSISVWQTIPVHNPPLTVWSRITRLLVCVDAQPCPHVLDWVIFETGAGATTHIIDDVIPAPLHWHGSTCLLLLPGFNKRVSSASTPPKKGYSSSRSQPQVTIASCMWSITLNPGLVFMICLFMFTFMINI